MRVGVGSGKASYVRWPQKYLTASLQSRAAIVTSAVVPNDGFPVGAFVVVVVSVVRAAKTSGGVVDKPKDAEEDQFVGLSLLTWSPTLTVFHYIFLMRSGSPPMRKARFEMKSISR